VAAAAATKLSASHATRWGAGEAAEVEVEVEVEVDCGFPCLCPCLCCWLIVCETLTSASTQTPLSARSDATADGGSEVLCASEARKARTDAAEEARKAGRAAEAGACACVSVSMTEGAREAARGTARSREASAARWAASEAGAGRAHVSEEEKGELFAAAA
jgi:hypothetical protein